MAIIPLKAWYLEQYEPIGETIARPPDLRLSRNSLLKSGLRVDFLEESDAIQTAIWFQRYLQGETVEFYIEGSGGYTISNIDLISHEIYFTKREINSWLEPTIFFSPQEEYVEANSAVNSALETALESLNRQSRLPLTLETSSRSAGVPLRLSDSQMRRIRQSLLFIADGTPLASIAAHQPPQLLLNSRVCVELGYAFANKRPNQILLLQMERPDLPATFPFDLPQHRQLIFKTAAELNQMLPAVLETLLQRYHLLAQSPIIVQQ
jgi:hypothetical protein